MFRFYLFVFAMLSHFAIAQTTTSPAAKKLFVDRQQTNTQDIHSNNIFHQNCLYCQEVKQKVILPIIELDEYKNKIIVHYVTIHLTLLLNGQS